MKASVHLIGDNINEVHEFYVGDLKALEKWQAAFTALLEDALNDGVNLEVIVVRSMAKELSSREKTYII